MNLATLTTRIRETIATGLPNQLSLGWATSDYCLCDLLKPWEKLYPGLSAAQLDAHRCQPFGYRSLLRTPGRLAPAPRRSALPLPVPWSIPSSPQLLQPSLLASIRGVWDYYKDNGLADKALLRPMLGIESLSNFVEPLIHICSDYSPLEMELENLNISGSVAGFEGFSLFIPCETYEEEWSGIIQAFLEGTSGVRWMVENYLSNAEDDGHGTDLPEKDKKLIAEVGLDTIITAYADNAGPTDIDLHKLGNFADTYFGQIQQDYPDLWDRGFDIISGDGGSNNSLLITAKRDIDFALTYCRVYVDMMNGFPEAWCLHENTDGAFDEMLHSFCNGWRKANGKRLVNFTSPCKQTLSYRFRTGDL